MFYSECIALNAEIERLKAENDKIDKESTSYALIIQKQGKEMEDLRLQNIELQKRNEKLFSDYCKDRKRLEKQCVRTVKQALKEFADELKAKVLDKTYINKDFDINISDIYKMIEENLKEYEK